VGGSKKQTVGYRYFMGLHFGLCHGPVDALLEIRGGDRVAWDGSMQPTLRKIVKVPSGDPMPPPEVIEFIPATGPITESGRITIHAPNLWGGEKKEGGIVGDLDVMMGEADQQPNDYLVEQLGTPMPAFRGMLSLVFRKGLVGAMNPYPKPWKFKVQRLLKGWHDDAPWYPAKAGVIVYGSVVVERDDSAWEYQVIPYHADPGNSQLTPPEIGWQPGRSPFWSTGWRPDGYPAGNTIWPAGTILWARRTFTIPPGSRARLDLYAENGCVAFKDGAELVAINRENTQVEDGAGSSPLMTAGTYNITVKAFDEQPPQGTTYLSASVVVPSILAMNPAHIVYEALTNPDWGLGYPEATIDLGSFTAAADTFHSEGLGLCGQWTRQDTVEGFIQDVMNHAGAVLAQDPRTALFRILPIRGGYVVSELAEFRRGLNVLEVQSFERASVTEATNEVTVEYTDVTSGNKGSVTVQHLANIQAQGGVASQTVRYPLIPTSGLAQRIALRDLNAKAQPICKVKLMVDRSAYGMIPGEVVRWTDSKLGIVDMPMRVLEVDYGTITAGAIRLSLAEDVFGMPATTYMGQQPPGWEEPPTDPKPSPAAATFETPYVSIHRVEGASAAAALAPGSGFLAMVAAKAPGLNYGFTLYTATEGTGYEQTGSGEWAASGILSEAIGPEDAALEVGGGYKLDALEPGDLAMLGDGPEAELVRIDATAPEDGVLAVGRGVGDTVPRAWPVGTRLWGIEDGGAVGATEYTEGETVFAKAATVGAGGEMLSLDPAPGGTVEMAARASRPYPPGAMRINGEAWPSAADGEIAVTWAHRDRLLQADQLVDQEAASIGPEPGTTYTMRTYLGGILIDTQADISGASATVTPAGNGLLRVELEAVRDGLPSWQKHVREFDYTAGPTNDRVTVGGDRRLTVGGAGRITLG